MAKETYKYIKSNGAPIIVEAAYKDGTGNNIASQYATKTALAQEVADRKEAISEITGGGGLLSLYRKAEDLDKIDAGIASTAAANLKTHTDNTTIHITANERTGWNTHSQSGPGLGTVHHNIATSKMEDDQTAIISIDSTNLAAKYDAVGNSITNHYATKTECNEKVDKVTGKGLSTNDYTNTEKGNVLTAYLHTTAPHAIVTAERNVIVAIQKNGEDLEPDLDRKVNIEVPTKTSDINNDSGFITKSVTNLDNYSTTTAMNEAISTATADMATNTGVANNYYNKVEISNNYSTTTAMNAAITSEVAAEATARATAISTAKSETQSWVEGKGYLTEHQDISGKVDETIQTAAGKALVTNEVDGGCIKFEGTTNWSAIAANDGGSGIGAQAYNWKVSGSTLQEGSVIDVTQDKIYYYNGAYTNASNRDKVENEIARIKDIPTLATLKLPEDITADIAVGHIADKLVIPKGTSLLDLIKMVFTTVDNTPYTYIGTMSNIPTSSDDIIAAAAADPSKMSKYKTNDIKNNLVSTAGYTELLNPKTEYVVVAIDKTTITGLNLQLSSIAFETTPSTAIPFATVSDSKLYIYYINPDGPITDDMGGYIIKCH